MQFGDRLCVAGHRRDLSDGRGGGVRSEHQDVTRSYRRARRCPIQRISPVGVDRLGPGVSAAGINEQPIQTVAADWRAAVDYDGRRAALILHRDISHREGARA